MAFEDKNCVNFWGQLTFSETDTFDFPKNFAQIGGEKCKGGEIAKILEKCLSRLSFGLNASNTYGTAEDKPIWWPKRAKKKDFKSHR